MRAWFHSWQHKTSKMMKIVQIGVLLAVIALIVLFILGYIFNWTWTGVGSYVSPIHPQGSDFQREKTLYDWFQLAIIPVALAVGVWWLNRLQQQRDQQLADQRAQTERVAAEKQAQIERDIALNNQHEATLTEYIDKMSELLLHEHLRESKPEDEVRKIARIWTALSLSRLDADRKRHVVDFLKVSELIKVDNIINMYGLILEGADLTETDLSGLNLSGVNLKGANLRGADLSDANLTDAIVTIEQLNTARSLKGAILRDGTKHD